MHVFFTVSFADGSRTCVCVQMSLEAEVVDHIEAAVSEDDSTASATSTVLQHVAQLSGQEMAVGHGSNMHQSNDL